MKPPKRRCPHCATWMRSKIGTFMLGFGQAPLVYHECPNNRCPFKRRGGNAYYEKRRLSPRDW